MGVLGVKLSKAAIWVITLLAATGIGYGTATLLDTRSLAQRDASNSVENISNVVGVIYLLDSGDVEAVRRALLGMGSSSLDPLIEQWPKRAGLSDEYLASRCRVVTRLKELRLKHNFLMKPSDEALRADPEIAEAERRRRDFLNSVGC